MVHLAKRSGCNLKSKVKVSQRYCPFFSNKMKKTIEETAPVLLYLLLRLLHICFYWHSLNAIAHDIISIMSQGNQRWILISGTVLSQSCPLLFTTMSNGLLSANQHGRPRQLPMCFRQYGPTRTWETLWARQGGTRATLRYLLLFPDQDNWQSHHA